MRVILLAAIWFPVLPGKRTAKNAVYHSPKSLSPVSDSLIYWDATKKIRWDYFLKPPPSAPQYSAEVWTGFTYSFYFNDTIISLKSSTFMNKTRSWVSVKTDDGLDHEQMHFNLREYSRRVFSNRVYKYLTSEKDSIKIASIRNIFSTATYEGNELQDRYDRETKHNLDSKAQKFWNHKIDSLLKMDYIDSVYLRSSK